MMGQTAMRFLLKTLISLLALVGLGYGQNSTQTDIGQAANFLAPSLAGMNKNLIGAQVIGTKGQSQYYYWVVVRYIGGNSTAAGPVFVSNAPNTLDVSNYVQVNFQGVTGATGYDLLRTTSAIFPNGTNNIAVTTNTTSTTINDQGSALTSYTPNSVSSATGTIYLNNRDYTSPQFEFYINGALVTTIPASISSGGITLINTTSPITGGPITTTGTIACPTCLTSTSGGLLYATYPTFGWTQSTSASTSPSNGYAYKATAPVYNPAAYNVYSPMWFDNAGFPPAYLIGGATNSVPEANTIFQVTSNAVNTGKHTALAGYVTTGDGNLSTQAGYLQNGKGTADNIIMYALNTHVAGCPAFKCDGTVVPDYDNGTLISIEADTEVRGLNQQGIGVYSACVNCVTGGLFTSAFLTFASPSLIHGDPAAGPWTAAYNTTEGSAVIGLNLNPLLSSARTATPKSNSMSQRQCSYTTNVAPYGLECWTQTYTQNSVLNRTSPGNLVYELGGSGSNLAALFHQWFVEADTSNTTINATSTGQVYTNAGATGTITYTLPNTVVAGEHITFIVLANQTINISAPGGTGFRDGGVTGTVMSSGTIGSVLYIVGVNPTTWETVHRTGNWAMNSAQLGTSVNGVLIAGTNDGNTPGPLRLLGNNGGGTTNEFRMSPSATGTTTVLTAAPATNPGTTLNANSPSSATAAVAQTNQMILSTTADSNSNFPFTMARAAIPLPNRSITNTTVSITNNNPQQLDCIAVNANQFTSTGRGFLLKGSGAWTVIVTDTPTFNFRITIYTDSACSTGAVDLATGTTYAATSTALTTAPWVFEAEAYYNLGTTAWNVGGFSVATTSTATNPTTKNIFASGTVFDPTTCTGNTCSVSLRITATGGTIAGTPTVLRNIDLLEYR